MASLSVFGSFRPNMFFFFYKNVLFYLGSGLTVYSQIVVKNMKIKAPKPVLDLMGLISVFFGIFLII